MVTQRLGFISLPLACLFIRILVQTLPRVSGDVGIAIVVLSWLCLVFLKLCISIILLGKASYIKRSWRENKARSKIK
eukprot:Pgem_evm1s3584